MKHRTGEMVGLVGVLFAAGLALAADPSRSEQTWITIGGRVQSADRDSFTLDYGGGTIEVEMDDWDWYPEAHDVLRGDYVTVRGVLDDELLEKRTLEAHSVYVKGLETYFFASPGDEEDHPRYAEIVPSLEGHTSLTGRITAVRGREFQVSTGAHRVTIDTRKLPDNPLDAVGTRRIGIGDRVYVSGTIDDGLFESREIEADAVILLVRDAPRRG